jgi:hypothetical protein
MKLPLFLRDRFVLPASSPSQRIRFDRNEWAGAFGDIGTDLPLILGMMLVAHLDSASVFILFGLMQILTALLYRMPMPVQPLKAVAALVIAQKLSGNVLYGGGLAIGLTMLVLTLTGLIDWLGRLVPKSVVRGIQIGLGLQLATLALTNYIPSDKTAGYVLAAVGLIIIVVLFGNRKVPAALVVIALGIVYAVLFKFGGTNGAGLISVHLPSVHVPTIQDIITGFLVLAFPQIPLSLGNSILATRQMTQDFFPNRPLSVRKISFTYSFMNLVNPFFGGVPTCHGSGGMAGHYTFGARTGGSIIIYGLVYVVLGLFFSTGIATITQIFPLPILGIVLVFESLTLLSLVRDLASSRADLMIALLVGLCASTLPYGYAIGLLVGTLVAYATRKGWTGFARTFALPSKDAGSLPSSSASAVEQAVEVKES